MPDFGLAVAEAVVRGVPVIVSESGAFSETVEQGVTGLFFANGNEDALLARLGEIASRAAFPSSQSDVSAVDRARGVLGIERHVERARAIFAEIVAPPVVR